MALTGIGIGLTGGSVVLSFILASLITVVVAIPTAFMGATLPTTGGYYRYTSRILSPRVGFFYLMVFIVGQITIAMYALSFAEYSEGIIPGVPIKLVVGFPQVNFDIFSTSHETFMTGGLKGFFTATALLTFIRLY